MLLSLKNLQKNYPGFSLDVSMEVEEGQITGLIGANGAGKSTTFKVILGLVHPDAGEIRLFNKDMEQISQKEKADIGATLSDSGFSNCLTVKQIVHILTETYEKFDREMFEKRCSLFSIPMDKKLKEFSTGMKAKLKVLTATSFDARLLVLDEPTAVLTERESERLFEMIRTLRERGVGIIYISHRLEEVLSLADRITVLRDGEYVGTLDNSQGAVTKEQLVSMMVGRTLSAYYPKRTPLLGKTVLKVCKLCKKGVYQDISFELH